MSNWAELLLTKCPRCGKYCDTKMMCIHGNPLSYHTCSCGYDGRNEMIRYTSRTGNIGKECI